MASDFSSLSGASALSTAVSASSGHPSQNDAMQIEENKRVEKKVFPAWSEYKKLWRNIIEVQKQRGKISKLSFQELEDLKLQTCELRLELELLDFKQKRRVRSIEHQSQELQGSTKQQGSSNNINIDKAEALLLGERARMANIDLEWDLDDEVLTTKDSSATETTPETKRKLQELNYWLNHEYVIHKNNQESMSTFAMHAGLDVEEIGRWVGDNENSKYFGSYENQISLREAISNNSKFMKQTIATHGANSPASKLEPNSSSIPSSRAHDTDDNDLWYMQKIAAALEQEENGLFRGVLQAQNHQEIEQHDNGTLISVSQDETHQIVPYVDVSNGEIKNKDNKKAEAFCNTCGMFGCGEDCWGFARKGNFPTSSNDVSFFIKNSLTSSTGAGLSDECSTCGGAECGLFCNKPFESTKVHTATANGDSFPNPIGFSASSFKNENYCTVISSGSGRQLGITTSTKVAARIDKGNAAQGDEVWTCGHCGKKDHLTSHCWNLHRENRPASFDGSCGWCGKSGHLKSQCCEKHPHLRSSENWAKTR